MRRVAFAGEVGLLLSEPASAALAPFYNHWAWRTDRIPMHAPSSLCDL